MVRARVRVRVRVRARVGVRVRARARVRVRVRVSPLTLTLTRAEAAGAVQVLRHGARVLPRRPLPLPARPGLELPRVTSRSSRHDLVMISRGSSW